MRRGLGAVQGEEVVGGKGVVGGSKRGRQWFSPSVTLA